MKYKTKYNVGDIVYFIENINYKLDNLDRSFIDNNQREKIGKIAGVTIYGGTHYLKTVINYYIDSVESLKSEDKPIGYISESDILKKLNKKEVEKFFTRKCVEDIVKKRF